MIGIMVCRCPGVRTGGICLMVGIIVWWGTSAVGGSGKLCRGCWISMTHRGIMPYLLAFRAGGVFGRAVDSRMIRVTTEVAFGIITWVSLKSGSSYCGVRLRRWPSMVF